VTAPILAIHPADVSELVWRFRVTRKEAEVCSITMHRFYQHTQQSTGVFQLVERKDVFYKTFAEDVTRFVYHSQTVYWLLVHRKAFHLYLGVDFGHSKED
jgi:hypothetical protein